jgi:anti-sigma B factor antagonist
VTGDTSSDPFEAVAGIGARVEQRGIRLGTVVDLIFHRTTRSLAGYEIVGLDGARRFLPQIACGAVTPSSVEVIVPTALLDSPELSFYRGRGVPLSSLGGPLEKGMFQPRQNGYSQARDAVATEFHASTTDLGDGIAAIAVVGEADLYTAPELKSALANAIDAGARGVLIDLSRTTFIDSTTLGVLMGAVRRLRQTGGEIAIVCRDPNIIKIFTITLLDRIFAITDSVAAGIERLQQSLLDSQSGL